MMKDVVPPHAGAYYLGEGSARHVAIYLGKRPRWLHRFMMRWAFGWEWRDAGPALSQSIAPTWTGRDA